MFIFNQCPKRKSAVLRRINEKKHSNVVKQTQILLTTESRNYSGENIKQGYT